MRLEYYSPEKLKKEVRSIIAKYLDLNQYKVFFFGSRITGKGNDRSDIDIGIKGRQPVSAKILLTIEEEIEKLPTLYKIEIVDFSQVAPNFKEVAFKKIEMIN